MITIDKKKGSRSECDNHRGISLLLIAGKILAKITLNPIKKLAEVVLTESQYGFRAGRSTIDMIFSLRQLQEKAIEQNQPLYMIFVDFSKAFDTADRETLWKVLKLYGCFEKVVHTTTLFHERITGAVRITGDTGEVESGNHSCTHYTAVMKQSLTDFIR